MSGLWLLSYIALWVLVILLVVIVLGIVRQLGVIHIRLGLDENLLSTREGLEIGAVAPDFRAADVMRNREISLAELKGRSSIFVFVSPDCQPCQELMPHLTLFNKSRNGKVNLVLFSQSDPQTSLELTKAHKLSVPVISDPEGGFLKLYQVRATPFAYRLDANGTVRRRGVVNNLEALEELLKDPLRGDLEVELPPND
jgi:methylamine dehydrogenase accessory protein MauD